MKRFLLLCLMTLLCSTTWAASNKYEYDFALANADGVTIYYRITSSNTVEVQNGSPTVYPVETYFGDVVVPETVVYGGKTYTVTGVGPEAFINCASLGTVELPNTITYFDDDSFYGSSISEITIPEGTTTFGYEVFARCTNLESIEFPESVDSIGNWLFAGCSNLRSVKLPSNLTRLMSSVFQSCSSLTEIELPNTVSHLYPTLFYGCTALEKVRIPSGATIIDHDVFSGCTALTSIVLPPRVEQIGSQAFLDCPNITSIYSYNPDPPSLLTFSNQFEGVSPECILYVPTGSKADYEKYSGYRDAFKEIVEMDMLTVSTSRATDVSDYSATISGEVVAGKSDIIEKGFQYWTGREVPTPIVVEGDEMSFTLTDLEPGTTYNFCAYATDEIGTIYGRTRTFTTSIPEGISSVATTSPAEVCAYYTTSGQRVNAPVKGVNIVRMSDGSARKVLVK